ncbi:nuclear fusion protein KAR5 [Chaetomidium leptoderma]|uniref:Nuclear fusion protein KAR5 n=1 Tax=Chaetomidium leptoderma TaxID=669021 RepID=A0AAN6VR19_9PEZI|nr:nuclear fusion protein KAR5 [Chaetomidium leptoderma]
MQARLLLLALSVLCVNGLSWRNERRTAVPATHLDKPSELLQNPRLPNIYAVALSELQELESEPLCHRVAARLLVNNCQLVDGKDEATVLTDSGRQVRDFVDSYAASLAICDLERGSFSIPKECAKFREPSLSQIAMRNEPQLHVSPREIGLCLSALAASDAAWSTWVSYRHKALRFCEAARADNEKSQNILLYQRLTRVIAQLTDGVEAELQKRMEDLDNRARQSVERLEQLAPQVGRLSEGLARVESYLSGDLDLALRKSSESARDGLQHAENLQQLLSVLLANALESNSQLAFAHEQSLQQASERVNDDMGALVAVVSTAIASSSSLQQQIQLSNQQATVLAQRQDIVEQGMNRLVTAAETMTTKFEDHSSMLKQANNITNDILDALEETAAVASSMNESFFMSATTRSWWPFVVFPTASLVMGSYGLPPSILRNIGLLAFGEAVGFVVSSYDQLTTQLFGSLEEIATNTTASSL